MYRYASSHRLIALLVMGVLYAQPALSTDTSQMIRDAVGQYDQGEFEHAIALLERVLDLEPGNGLAAYELTLSHQAKGDLKACIKVAKRYLRRLRKDPAQAELLPQLSTMQASCHSTAGETRRALRVFRAALRKNPDNYGLNFNISITLLNDGNYAGAIPYLEKAVRADPFHPSPYYVIGKAYKATGQTVKSLLAYFRFLQREFNTSRCAAAAQAIIDVAYASVRPDAAGTGTTIILSGSSDSADVTTLTLALALATVASMPDGKIKEPVVESVSRLLQQFISIAAGLQLEPDPDSFLVSYLLPDVIEIERAGVASAFSYFILSSAGIDGASEWLGSHTQETDELIGHFEMLAATGYPKE